MMFFPCFRLCTDVSRYSHQKLAEDLKEQRLLDVLESKRQSESFIDTGKLGFKFYCTSNMTLCVVSYIRPTLSYFTVATDFVQSLMRSEIQSQRRYSVQTASLPP